MSYLPFANGILLIFAQLKIVKQYCILKQLCEIGLRQVSDVFRYFGKTYIQGCIYRK